MQAVAQLIYFSKNRQYAQWLSAKMHVGEMVVVGGTSSAFNGKLQFTHPQILTVSAVEESDSLHQSRDTGKKCGRWFGAYERAYARVSCKF